MSMTPEQIRTINTIAERLPQCPCNSVIHKEGCVVPMILDLQRQANETRHTITILKLDREIAEAKRLAEAELVEIFGPYTDHVTQITSHELHERFANRGLKGYLIHIDVDLTVGEMSAIRNKWCLREWKLIGNVGQIQIDGIDIGFAYREFFKI